MKTFRAFLLLALVLLFVGGTPSLAGVVEDAEEALQSVPSDAPGQRQLDGTDSTGRGGAGRPLTAPSSVSTSSSAGTSSEQFRTSRTSSSRDGSAAGSQGGNSPAADLTPSAARQEAVDRRKARDDSDTALSLGAMLLLLVLVLAAGLYSRRARHDD